jgi:hypothetical protein
MPSRAEELVSAFFSLEDLGVLRRRWLLSAKPLIARAESELAPDERVHHIGVGENPDGVLEGILVTDERLCVIDRTDVRWYSRQGIWEASSASASSAPGEALRVYGDTWELGWTQIRPASVGDKMRLSLTERRSEILPPDGLPEVAT